MFLLLDGVFLGFVSSIMSVCMIGRQSTFLILFFVLGFLFVVAENEEFESNWFCFAFGTESVCLLPSFIDCQSVSVVHVLYWLVHSALCCPTLPALNLTMQFWPPRFPHHIVGADTANLAGFLDK